MSLGQRIRKARENAGLSMTELGKRIGVSRTAIGQWETDEHIPRKGHVQAMAKVLGVPPSAFDIFGSSVSVTHVSEWADSSLILLIQWGDLRHLNRGKVAMHALTKEQYIHGDGDLSSDCFAVRIEDASMEPTFQIGDIIVFDSVLSPQANDFVLTRMSGNRHAFRLYVPRRNGAFDLVAENPDWPTMTANTKTPAQILGTMVEHRRKRRRA